MIISRDRSSTHRLRTLEIRIRAAQDDCFEAIIEHCHARIRRYILSLSDSVDHVEEGQTNLTRHGVYPLYNPSVFHRESKEDIERLGEYCAYTHAEYIKLSHQRWTDINALVHQVSSTENWQAAKSLADLAYQVRQSTSFRNFLAFVYQHQRTRITKMVEQMGKISRFYRSALTIIQVAAKFCKDVSYISVKTLGFPKRAVDLLSSRTPIDLASRLPLTSRSRLQGETETAKQFLSRWRRYVVHAEMQLLLFYENRADIRLACNYIGISKRSCYLCAAFIRFHGQFVMEGAHQQLYSLWTIPSRITFQSVTKKDNFKRALSTLCDDVNAKVNTISVHSYCRFPFHVESVANFSRASLLSNGATAETYNLRATAPMTAAQRSFNVDETLGEKEPPSVLGALLPDGMLIEGQQNTVSWIKNKLLAAPELESIENIPNDYAGLPRGKTSPGEKRSAGCSLHKDDLGPPATLTEGISIGAGKVIADSSPHNTEAASERSRGISGKEIHSQENILRRRRRRRRRRSDGMSTVFALNRRYSQGNRNGAQYKKKRRHRHRTQSNMAQNRKEKRTSDGGIVMSSKVRKGAKTLSGRKMRGMPGRLGDDGIRYRSMRAKLHAESENDEMSCVYLIRICTKAVGDFFRGVLTGW